MRSMPARVSNCGKWTVDDHPLATITGTPKTHGNRIYVSTTALEEVAGSDPQYECCTFRGKLMALNRFNGKLVWTGYTLPDPHRTDPQECDRDPIVGTIRRVDLVFASPRSRA